MAHTITYNPDLHIIEIKYQGNATVSELREVFSESMKVAREQDCFLFLSDFSEAKLKLSTLDIYELPDILSGTFASSGIPAYKLKRALIAEKDLEDYRFFETVTSNRGQYTKIFQDVARAREWLLKK